MSTTSTRTCPSGRPPYTMSVPSYLLCQSHMACTLVTFFMLQDTGWLAHISVVENVQPKTKTAWSVTQSGHISLISPLNTRRHELRLPLCILSSDPKAETRLYVTVNGFEFHVYNRTDLYARLQETFGLEPTLITPKRDEERGREDRDKTLERFGRRQPDRVKLIGSALIWDFQG